MSGRGESRLFRLVPGDSPVHRLWAGTKLVALTALAGVLMVRPSWGAVAVVAALEVVTFYVARLPRSVLGRPPRWLWLAGAAAVGIGVLTGGAAGLTDVARFTLLTVLVAGGAALLGWTTSPADVAPALTRLGRPFRRIGVPVDEWVTTVALGIRALPQISDEVRTLRVARRLRPAVRSRRWRDRLAEPANLMVAALVVSTRRARDLGQAMEARGGSLPSGGAHPRRAGGRPGRRAAVAVGYPPHRRAVRPAAGPGSHDRRSRASDSAGARGAAPAGVGQEQRRAGHRALRGRRNDQDPRVERPEQARRSGPGPGGGLRLREWTGDAGRVSRDRRSPYRAGGSIS
jgi:energy-coupling factor transport system permease protein